MYVSSAGIRQVGDEVFIPLTYWYSELHENLKTCPYPNEVLMKFFWKFIVEKSCLLSSTRSSVTLKSSDGKDHITLRGSEISTFLQEEVDGYVHALPIDGRGFKELTPELHGRWAKLLRACACI
jgi:hypothetical protein